MKNDSLKQYVTLRSALLKERAMLEARLNEINKALSGEVSPAPVAKGVRPARRPKNTLSLKSAVVKVTKDKPLGKSEIMTAIDKLGYKFKAKDPMNSLNTLLYTKGLFRNTNGKFSPSGAA